MKEPLFHVDTPLLRVELHPDGAGPRAGPVRLPDGGGGSLRPDLRHRARRGNAQADREDPGPARPGRGGDGPSAPGRERAVAARVRAEIEADFPFWALAAIFMPESSIM